MQAYYYPYYPPHPTLFGEGGAWDECGRGMPGNALAHFSKSLTLARIAATTVHQRQNSRPCETFAEKSSRPRLMPRHFRTKLLPRPSPSDLGSETSAMVVIPVGLTSYAPKRKRKKVRDLFVLAKKPNGSLPPKAPWAPPGAISGVGLEDDWLGGLRCRVDRVYHLYGRGTCVTAREIKFWKDRGEKCYLESTENS